MSIYLNKDSKVIVQGITGGEGTKHTALMLKAGTQVVGGVNARKAGTTVSHTDKDGNPVELPVFASVAEAMEKTGADVSIAFVPPAFTKDAMIEAIDAEIPLLVVITEGVPVGDTAEAWAYTQSRDERYAEAWVRQFFAWLASSPRDPLYDYDWGDSFEIREGIRTRTSRKTLL